MKSNESRLENILYSWTATSVGRREFLQSLPILLSLSACATRKSTKERLREGDNSGQEITLTPSDEKKLTQEVLPSMTKDYPAHKSAALQNYISQLGQRIVRLNQLHNNPYEYQFSVVDVGYVNAFALPAGVIMITAPLLAMAATEAELVGVIGHEIGHIKARHTAERMEEAKRTQKKTWLLGAAGGLIGGAAGFGLGKALCPPKDSECLQKATVYGAAAGAGGALLIQKYAFMANSREDEMEADRIGFRVAVKAGYDKDEVGAFYTKLLEMEKKHKKNHESKFMASLADALSTHPPSEERVKQMQQLAQSAPASGSTIKSTSEFERMKKLAAQSVKS